MLIEQQQDSKLRKILDKLNLGEETTNKNYKIYQELLFMRVQQNKDMWKLNLYEVLADKLISF